MTQTLTVRSASHLAGALDAAGERTFTLARPFLGFPGSRLFRLRGLGERYEPFMSLSSLDEPSLGFIVVAPGALFSDYVVEIADADVALLGLEGSDDVEMLVLVSRHPGATPTVNLIGPLVVNRRTEVGTQIVLQDSPYAVAVPVDAPSACDRAARPT